MTDKLTNAYALHAELVELEERLQKEKAALRVNGYAQQFFTVATWIVYLLFAAAMYAAPLWVLQSFFGANAGNYLAIIVIGVFLVVFPTALSLGKHVGLKALAKRGIDIRYAGLIFAFFIASGVYMELTSASSQQQEKAHQAVENSNAGKAIMDSTVSTSTSAYAGLIADAEFKLVACQRKLAEGKVKDCNNSQARLDSLKAQSEADRQAAITANTAAITAKQAALDKERDSHALPIAKTFAAVFGVAMAVGSIIAATIAAFIFEISHVLTVYNEWRIEQEINLIQQQLKHLKVNYFHQTGKQFNATDFKEGEIIDLVEMRENGKIEHFSSRLQDGISPTPAAKNDGAYGDTRIGFTANRDDRPFYGFKDPKKQAALDALNLAQGSEDRKTWEQRTANAKTYRQALRDGEKLYPTEALDTPLDTHSDRYTHSPDDTHSDRYTHSEEKLDDRLQKIADDLYLAWVAAVQEKVITHAKEPCQKFIWKNAVSDDGKTVLSAPETFRIWNVWQARAAKDGILVINPKYTGKPPHPKYILA